MIDAIAVNKFSGSFTGIFNDIFYRVQKTFIGMKYRVLHFVQNVFFVNSLVFFLSAVGTEIFGNRIAAVGANRIHGGVFFRNRKYRFSTILSQ